MKNKRIYSGRIFEYEFDDDSYLDINQISYVIQQLEEIFGLTSTDLGSKKIRFCSYPKQEIIELFNGKHSYSELDNSKFKFIEKIPIPVPFKREISIVEDNNCYMIEFDLPAIAFILLNRVEEQLNTNLTRDKHGRARTEDLFLFKSGLIDIPFIDYFMQISSHFLRVDRPEMQLHLTQDIDHVCYSSNFFGKVKGIFSDLKNYRLRKYLFIENLKYLFKSSKSNDILIDSINNYLNLLKENSLKATFFLMISKKTDFDSGYDIDGNIKEIINRIQHNGHEIGLHPSYYTAVSEELLEDQITSFNNKIGLIPKHIRHHYLRNLDNSNWLKFEKFGVEYDHSIGMSDNVGFRVGTGKLYSPYDFNSKRALKLKILPMTIMDDVVYSKGADWKSHVLNHLKICKKYRSDSSILFHNSRLIASKGFCREISAILESDVLGK